MKRTLVALALGGAVFTAVYGLAASLGVSSNALGAGSSTTAACQAGTLTTGFATLYDSVVPGYKVGVVTVSGLDTTSPTNCASKPFKITLTAAGNVSLGEVTGTTPATGTTFTADFTPSAVAASGVSGVHVVISG